MRQVKENKMISEQPVGFYTHVTLLYKMFIAKTRCFVVISSERFRYDRYSYFCTLHKLTQQLKFRSWHGHHIAVSIIRGGTKTKLKNRMNSSNKKFISLSPKKKA